MEMRKLDLEIIKKRNEEDNARSNLESWVFYSDPIDLNDYISISCLKTSRGNIAGVNIPMLDEMNSTKKSQIFMKQMHG